MTYHTIPYYTTPYYTIQYYNTTGCFRRRKQAAQRPKGGPPAASHAETAASQEAAASSGSFRLFSGLSSFSAPAGAVVASASAPGAIPGFTSLLPGFTQAGSQLASQPAACRRLLHSSPMLSPNGYGCAQSEP